MANNQQMTVHRGVRQGGRVITDADELNAALEKDQIETLKASGAISGDGWGGKKSSKSGGEKLSTADIDSKDATVRAGKIAARRRKLLDEQTGEKKASESRSAENTGRATNEGEPVKTTATAPTASTEGEGDEGGSSASDETLQVQDAGATPQRTTEDNNEQQKTTKKSSSGSKKSSSKKSSK